MPERYGAKASGAGVGPRATKKCWPLVVFALATGASLRAHDFSTSESSIEIDGSTVRARVSVNLLEFPGTDVSGDQRISYDELDKNIERVFGSIKKHYTLAAPDAPDGIVADRYQIVDDHVLQIDIRYTFGHAVGQLELQSTLDEIFGPTHQHLARAAIAGEVQREILDASNRTAHFDARRVTAARVLTIAVAALGLAGLAVYRYRSTRSSTRRPEL